MRILSIGVLTETAEQFLEDQSETSSWEWFVFKFFFLHQDHDISPFTIKKELLFLSFHT